MDGHHFGRECLGGTSRREIIGRRPVYFPSRQWLFTKASTFLILLLLCLIAWGCGGRKRVTQTMPQPPSSAVEPSARPTLPGEPLLIRVGLATELTEVAVGISGPSQLLAGDDRQLVANLAAGVKVKVQASRGELKWEAGQYGGEAELLFIQPHDPSSWLTWSSDSFRGEFLLFPVSDRVTVVNIVELEDYLCGVVPWEIGRPGPEARAAVEAQAVAARTYTIAHLGERAGFGFDVWADVQDQVYRGAGDEDETCNTAVARTAGWILQSSGQEIEAYYSSTCGGWTSDVAQVWPRPARPYLDDHRDAQGDGPEFCAGARYFTWEVVWSRQELENILTRTLPDYLDYVTASATRSTWAGTAFTPRSRGADARRPGRLRDMAIANRTSSGRVGRLDLTTESGVYHVRGDRVRWVLVPPDGKPFILRSALFDLQIQADDEGRPARITASGHGFGHGVGMCQEGSLAMARQGYQVEEILAHYYPGSRLESYHVAGPGGTGD